jgi:hypothetical protein
MSGIAVEVPLQGARDEFLPTTQSFDEFFGNLYPEPVRASRRAAA